MTKPDLTVEDRPAGQRLLSAVLYLIAGLFLLGMTAGVAAAIAVKGLPPTSKLWIFLLPAITLPLGLLALRKAWKMAVAPGDGNAFEQRYRKMWLWVMLLGMPIGVGMAFPLASTDGKLNLNPLSQGPLSPGLAIGITLVGALLLLAAFVVYHRTIDEQEERGYLWGTQVAYYFLSIAYPAWWLLERGALLPAMTTGIAIALLLISFVIQGAVWAWFKFR